MQFPHYGKRSHQSNDLSRLADDGKVLEALEDEGDVEGADGHQVDQVHCIFHKPKYIDIGIIEGISVVPHLVRTDKEPDEELNSEEDDDDVVNHLNDEHHCRVLDIASGILLYWLDSVTVSLFAF